MKSRPEHFGAAFFVSGHRQCRRFRERSLQRQELSAIEKRAVFSERIAERRGGHTDNLAELTGEFAQLVEACPQAQVLTCSELLVFATRQQIDAALVDEYIDHVAHERDTQVDALGGYAKAIKDTNITTAPGPDGYLQTHLAAVGAPLQRAIADVEAGVAAIEEAEKQIARTP